MTGAASLRSPHALTRIIATLGPASSDVASIARLVEAGARIFRLNFSHGDEETHGALVRAVRTVSEQIGEPLTILGDLPGPKIRLHAVTGGVVEVLRGAMVEFVRGDGPCRVEGERVVLATNYPSLLDDLREGDRVLIDDGAVRLLVTERSDDLVRCTVTAPGSVSAGKGVNLPDTAITAPSIGPRDLAATEWSIAHDLDVLALSFVRTAQDIRDLRSHIDACAERAGLTDLRLPIVAKIERPEAVENAESIIAEADATMIARGDLGVELDLWRVPVIQRRLIDLARELGRPCIVATQMLQSMIDAPTPTRAEASDVANAIMEGVDAVMLSGETAVGNFASLAVETMRRIADHTEAYVASRIDEDGGRPRPRERFYRTAALAHGVWHIAHDNRARCLAVWSQLGGGARYLSQNYFAVPIVACSSDLRALRQMQLHRGVVPVAMDVPPSLNEWTDRIDAWLVEHGFAEIGDRAVLVAGAPLGQAGSTNCIALHEIGNPRTGFR